MIKIPDKKQFKEGKVDSGILLGVGGRRVARVHHGRRGMVAGAGAQLIMFVVQERRSGRSEEGEVWLAT